MQHIPITRFQNIRRFSPWAAMLLLIVPAFTGRSALAQNSQPPPDKQSPPLESAEDSKQPLGDLIREAVTYQRIGDYTKAIAVLTRAIDQEPKVSSILLLRGDVYIHIAVAEQRIADCTKDIEQAKDNEKSFLQRGFAYYNTGEYERAIADYTTALARQPNYAAAYLGRGLAYVAQGKMKEGLADYERAFALRPGMRPSHRDTLFQAFFPGKKPPTKSNRTMLGI